jgi:poly(3-hydroxybutyrate) depolymerase
MAAPLFEPQDEARRRKFQKEKKMTSSNLIEALTKFTQFLLVAGFALIAGQATAEQLVADIGGREVIIVVPNSGIGPSTPMMLMLHGGLGNARDFKGKIDMAAEANANGFVVAYLNGTEMGRRGKDRRTWNAGTCCGDASKDSVDDVAYIAQVIQSLGQSGYGNTKKVVLVGHSNGAMMALRYACTRPNSIRGVIALAGTLTMPSCSNANGVDIQMYAGTRDRTVPIEGGGKGDFVQDQPFVPLSTTVAMLQAGGANVSVQTLNGASHTPSSINSAAQSQLGASVQQIAAGFLMRY